MGAGGQAGRPEGWHDELAGALACMRTKLAPWVHCALQVEKKIAEHLRTHPNSPLRYGAIW